MNYRTIPPIQVIAGLPFDEANQAPTGKGLRPGTAVTRMMGEAAEVGEAHEVWWAASKAAFAVDIDGKIYPELQLIRMRLDTPGAKPIRKHVRGPDGNVFVQLVGMDWSEAHDVLQQKGWLRIDPVLKEFGITPDGLLTQEQWRIAQHHRKVCDALCNGKVLRRIAEVNEATWSVEFQGALRNKMEKLMRPYVLDSEADGRRKLRTDLSKVLESDVNRWLKAFQDAMAPETVKGA